MGPGTDFVCRLVSSSMSRHYMIELWGLGTDSVKRPVSSSNMQVLQSVQRGNSMNGLAILPMRYVNRKNELELFYG
ncbi:hypothetical protein GOBAR_AA11442 [Gossypium barbadense]|uniref:Uncharacterized protein n=1 Tax=Gossypium barbadense TaxID=3634 RepID=A0A2P5Y0T8_GOSBA|nr:hypothetical protein GOBAR_AA11442 [Gossypium barbadense]